MQLYTRAPNQPKTNQPKPHHADPLIMSNGVDMLDMVCNSYESPPEGERAGAGEEEGTSDDEAEQCDFSECGERLVGA